MGESGNSGIHEGICYPLQDELGACGNLGRHTKMIYVWEGSLRFLRLHCFETVTMGRGMNAITIYTMVFK